MKIKLSNGMYIDSDTAYRSEDGVVYSKDGTEIYSVPKRKKNFIIPYKVTTFNPQLFKEDTLKRTVDADGNNSYSWELIVNSVSIEKNHPVFRMENDLLLEANKVIYAPKNITEVVIPDGVTEIGESAFYGCRKLKKVHLPDGIRVIDDYAFERCCSLSEINLPDSVEWIGKAAFRECSFKNITIPHLVNKIESSVFEECSMLEEIALPKGIASIETAAFHKCTALKEITIPENVTEIKSMAFAKCSNLERIFVSENLCKITGDAFHYCEKLNVEDIFKRMYGKDIVVIDKVYMGKSGK